MAVMPSPASAAPVAPSKIDIADLPGQVRALIDQSLHWLRHDSLAALIGCVAAVGIYLLLEGVKLGGCRLLGDGDTRTLATWRAVLGHLAKRTRSWFLAALSADLVARFVAPPGNVQTAINFVFTVAAVIQAASWIRELILTLVDRRASQGEGDHQSLASAMGIIRLLTTIGVGAIALIVLLDNAGVNVSGLIAGLGVGGIAIGLAAQGVFADLFAALAILFDHPFRAGETIKFGQTIGTVERIGLKSTRIRSVDGEMIIVANRKLLDEEIHNLKRLTQRRVVLTLPLSPQTSSAKLAAVPDLLKAAVEGRKDARFQHAVALAAGPNSLDVEFVFFSTKPSAEVRDQLRHAVLVDAKARLEAAGILFADLTPPRG